MLPHSGEQQVQQQQQLQPTTRGKHDVVPPNMEQQGLQYRWDCCLFIKANSKEVILSRRSRWGQERGSRKKSNVFSSDLWQQYFPLADWLNDRVASGPSRKMKIRFNNGYYRFLPSWGLVWLKVHIYIYTTLLNLLIGLMQYGMQGGIRGMRSVIWKAVKTKNSHLRTLLP